MTDGQNMREQSRRGRRSKHAQSNCILCIPFILSGSPNKFWLHTCDACIIRTWRLVLQAPLVTSNNICNSSFGASFNGCQFKTALSKHPVDNQGKVRMIYNTIPAGAVACVITGTLVPVQLPFELCQIIMMLKPVREI